MIINWDSWTRTTYVYIDDGPVRESRFLPNVRLDLDEAGRVLGIEIPGRGPPALRYKREVQDVDLQGDRL